MGLWDGTGDYSWMNQDIGGTGGGMGIGSFGNLFGSILGGQQSQAQQPVQQAPQATPAQQQPTVWGLTPEDWRNIQYMTGAMGQGALKGTDMEWLGNMGGVSAQMAKNAQVSSKNKEFQNIVSAINNPNVSSTAYTEKLPDGTTRTWKAGGTAQDYTQQIPSLVNQQNAVGQSPQTPATNATTQGLGDQLARGPSFFDPAQKPWWLRLGQQG